MEQTIGINNGASTGTRSYTSGREGSRGMITMEDIGILKGSLATYEEMDDEETCILKQEQALRKFMRTLNDEEKCAMEGLMMLLWEGGDMTADIREIRILEQDSFKYQVICNLKCLEVTVEQRIQADYKESELNRYSFPTRAPISSFSAELQLKRKLPQWTLFDGSTAQTRWNFVAAMEPVLKAPGMTLDDAKLMLETLMIGSGSRFLTSRGFRTSRSSLDLFANLLLEAEHVYDEGALRSEIFHGGRLPDETFLQFMDRIDVRHRLYCSAYPRANPEHAQLLHRCRRAIRRGTRESAFLVVIRDCKTVSDACDAMVQVGDDQLYDDPPIMRASNNRRGVNEVCQIQPPAGEEEEPIRDLLSTMNDRIDELMMMNASANIVRGLPYGGNNPARGHNGRGGYQGPPMNGGGGRGGGYPGAQVNQGGDNRGRGGGGGRGRPIPLCFACKLAGHKVADCPLIQAVNDGRMASRMRGGNNHTGPGPMVPAPRTAVAHVNAANVLLANHMDMEGEDEMNDEDFQ